MNDQLRDDIRFINKFLYSIQKHRIALGAWIGAKERDAEKGVGTGPSKRALALSGDMEKQEAAAKRMALDIVSMHPLWGYFFLNQRGVAHSLATSLMAEIGDISRFDTPSALCAYAGLVGGYVEAKCSKGHKMLMSSDKNKTCVIFENEAEERCGGKITITERVEGKSPKRKAGYHYLFNSRLKTICWKISGQLVKQGDDYYRHVYYQGKEFYRNKAISQGLTVLPAIQIKNKKDKSGYMSEGHIENRARRRMVKHFLVHFWEAWREIDGLELRTPYVIEKLGHKGYVSWAELLERIREMKKAQEPKKGIVAKKKGKKKPELRA